MVIIDIFPVTLQRSKFEGLTHTILNPEILQWNQVIFTFLSEYFMLIFSMIEYLNQNLRITSFHSYLNTSNMMMRFSQAKYLIIQESEGFSPTCLNISCTMLIFSLVE